MRHLIFLPKRFLSSRPTSSFSAFSSPTTRNERHPAVSSVLGSDTVIGRPEEEEEGSHQVFPAVPIISKAFSNSTVTPISSKLSSSWDPLSATQTESCSSASPGSAVEAGDSAEDPAAFTLWWSRWEVPCQAAILGELFYRNALGLFKQTEIQTGLSKLMSHLTILWIKEQTCTQLNS